MKKISNFEFTSKTGKAIVVTVTRIYGKENVEYNADGDKTVVSEFVDKSKLTVSIDGKTFRSYGIRDYKGMSVIPLMTGNVMVAVPDEIASEIIAASKEQLTADISPAEQNEIDAANAAIDEGKVMPAAEIKEKREGYRKMMGGECFNPYDYCMSAERVAELRAKHPGQVKREYVFVYDTDELKDIHYALKAFSDEKAAEFCDMYFAEGISGKLYEYDADYKPGRLVCEHVCRHEG